jgi:hypothetical protein
MCRTIWTLYNFDPPATNEEIGVASLVTQGPAEDRELEAARRLQQDATAS